MSKKALITGATGDTGRAAVRESIALGLDVRAMVRRRDARSEALGAEVVTRRSPPTIKAAPSPHC